ncbi:pyridoxamine 5'-phosphate oxidase family protein [uncultured Pseudoflavonifractor sp.]|uniref:pyridoxamine 5'-phosphate oxidase family protein n=1 Tax=uncultured Pseudoflavonifractor sp. TaxID=1221379 RepID=UPI0025EF5C52|nr:pyridoxamine 5'-phosphate oxidase family protein [uncultured Pseudoflavonifractor sp.]
MFREMRRKRQALPQEEVSAVLERGTSGVLALAGEDGYPYAVPISYVYDGEKFYFHCARAGHKLDAIRREPKASFCVIDQDQIVPAEYTTYFRSVIAFGRLRVLEDEGEKRAAIEKLAAKYAPDQPVDARAQAIDREWLPLCMLEMTVEHLTGKEAIELAGKRPQPYKSE